MDYIIMGLLIGTGWHLAGLIIQIIEIPIMSRLKHTEWYQVASGTKPRKIKNAMGIKTVENKIGF